MHCANDCSTPPMVNTAAIFLRRIDARTVMRKGSKPPSGRRKPADAYPSKNLMPDERCL